MERFFEKKVMLISPRGQLDGILLMSRRGLHEFGNPTRVEKQPGFAEDGKPRQSIRDTGLGHAAQNIVNPEMGLA